MATIDENFTSRSFTIGKQAVRELAYNILGTDDDVTAMSLLGATAPGNYQGLLLDSLNADHLGGGVWKGYARYIVVESSNEYTFDTGGGSQKVTQSLDTFIYDFVTGYDYYGDDVGTGPDFGGAIGVDGDRVEGVDITVPQYIFSETHYIADILVTQAYKITLFQLTGTTNNATFKGFDAGEVLFLGATGAKRGDTQWAVTFRFACSPGTNSLVVGIPPYDIGPITKKGWDYLWFRYDDFEDEAAFALVKRPVAAYVEKVYYDSDFSLLGIGT